VSCSSFSKLCFDVWIWILCLARRSHSADKEQVGDIACTAVIRLLLSFIYITLFIALNSRSQSTLLGDRVSKCHKQLVEFIKNAYSTSCLVFNSTKMNFLVVEMKGLTLTFDFVFAKARIFMYQIVWIQTSHLTNTVFVHLLASCNNTSLCSV